jgi:hypothetical protein
VGYALSINTKRRGRHQWYMSLLTLLETTEVSNFPSSITLTSSAYHLEFENIASIMYCIGIIFSKLYMQVFVPCGRGDVCWANQVLIWVNALFYFGVVVALICQCIPREKISNPTLSGT